jgi:beta-N-acetylhexosaminidase
MTAHIVCPALDPRRPATLSPRVLRHLLRRRLGFHGVLFSDDLEMRAVAARATPGRLAVRALSAGCDMLLVCQSLDTAREAIHGVADALARGTLDPKAVAASLARIQGLRRRMRPAPPAAPLRWPAHERLARRLTPPAESASAASASR